MRSLLFSLVFGGTFFFHRDEPPKSIMEIEGSTTAYEQTFTRRVHFGLARKKMLRLEQSTNDDRNL